MPRQPFRVAACTVALLVCSNLHVYGQLFASKSFSPFRADSGSYSLSESQNISEASEVQFSDAGESNLHNLADRKHLLGYLKSIRVENNAGASQARARFYYRLANTFARLRLYPLAMKCFLKTMPGQVSTNTISADSLKQVMTAADTDLADNDTEKYLAINAHDDSLFNQRPQPLKSKAITYQRIRQTFDDGKKAVAYAMLFHVKQPVRGKRKIFVLNNVGHTFITLIKYNSDSTYTSLSFGFYPKKDNLLSATPLIPSTSSVFKDDSGHDWDEVLGKFISHRRFERIQGLILKYNGVKYNLSKNNCTDFGLQAAKLAGIGIPETYGTWPLGQGNNPGVTGQSILEHRFFSTDTGSRQPIFMDSAAPGSN